MTNETINLEETTRRFKLLKKEMIAEANNGMKIIARKWHNEIFPEYRFYRNYGLTTQESFYCALMDTGHLNLEDLKNV